MEKVGKYFLKEFLASGGMAEIYKGYLEGPHGFVKDVVIKAIHPHLLRDERYINLFLREARLWGRLNHSSIVQVYEFFEEKNRYYIVMEYVKGTDLFNIIKRSMAKGKPIGIPRILKIFEYVLSALEYAHNFRDDSENIFGIVHRDISPQNILVSINGDVKITDFGIAKASLSSGLTAQGAIIGKIDYMSPEQALGKDVDHRTDIYSTGVVLWEALTGNKLFDGKSDLELLENVRRGEIIHPSAINPEVDERLERIVLKALSYDRDFRYRSCEEFSNDLKSYLREYPHDIEEENIASFMRDLFPEYVKDYTHKTELLEVEEEEKKRVFNSKAHFIAPLVLSLIVFAGLAVFFYPKDYTSLDTNDVYVKDILAFDLFVDDVFIYDISLRDDESDNESLMDSEDAGLINKSVSEKMISTEVSIKESGNQKKKREITKKGRLSVNAIPWADVYIGKKKIGTTPIFDYEIRSGGVEVIFRNDELGVVRKKRLTIESDKETRHTEDLTK